MKAAIFLSGQKEIRNKGIHNAFIFYYGLCLHFSFLLRKCYRDRVRRLGRALNVNGQWLQSSSMAQDILPTISKKDFSLFLLSPGYQARYRKVMSKTQILSVPK